MTLRRGAQSILVVPCKYSRASWISCLDTVCTPHETTIGTARPTSRLSHGPPARPFVWVHLVVRTVNFEGVKDFQIPRCLFREHGQHLEKFLETDSFGEGR